MEKLPHEVLSDIFIRLLAKQLAQMRCVCKPWNALLSQSSFVKSHLHRSIHNYEEILLFFHDGFSFDSSPFTARLSRSPHLKLCSFIELPVSPQSKNSRGSVIGSVNGLICFSYGSYHDNYVVHIWNPSLSVVLTLPPCSLPSGDLTKIYFRFGFDPKTDDYKVVRLTGLFEPRIMLPEVEVYSMRKGSWELISQRFPSHITTLGVHNEICVDGHDGHLHWLGYTGLERKPQTIVEFDLCAEAFCEIPLPDPLLHRHGDCYIVLGVMAGKLCVMSCVRDGECEVWVMDEYGVAESWVKHHTFSQLSGDIAPYGFTLQNEFMFEDNLESCFGDSCLALYDPVQGEAKNFKITFRAYGVTKVVEYVDSLVWVASAEHETSCHNISQFQFCRGSKRKGIISTFLTSCYNCSA